MRRFQSRCGKAKAGEHRAHLRFDGVAVARAEFALGADGSGRPPAAYSALVGIELGHAVRQLFLLLFERAQIVEDGHAFGEDGAAGEREAVLREVADAGALLGDHGAGIEAFDAGQHLEQRRFAGAVGADDAGALVGRDQPVGIFKKDFGAVAFACPGELDHPLHLF